MHQKNNDIRDVPGKIVWRRDYTEKSVISFSKVVSETLQGH